MQNDLFSKPAEYTIDGSSLMDIFNDTPWVSKKVIPGLWRKVEELIHEGIIISHMEVLLEIKKDGQKGEELYNWAHSNEHIFKDYNIKEEGKIIKGMSQKYKQFVNQKINSVNADPWLIAQAKNLGLKLISEETFSASPDIAKHKIPNVCRDPSFMVSCINLSELAKERGWTFN